MKTSQVPALLVATVMAVLVSGGLSAQTQTSAKVNYIEGEASLQSGSQGEWLKVKPGDRVNVTDNFWVNQNSRAELLVGDLVIGLNSETSLTLESGEENTIEFKLWLGSMIVRFPGDRDQQIRIETPNLSFALNQPGEYRLDVNAAGDETVATVWSGEGESTGGGARYVIHAAERAELRGTDKIELVEVEPASSADDFDQWAIRRDEIAGAASASGEPSRTDEPGPTDSGDGNADKRPDDSGGTERQATLWPIGCPRPWCELDAYPTLQREVYGGFNVWWRGVPCDPFACGMVFSDDASVGSGLRPPLVPPKQRPRARQTVPVALQAAGDESRFSRDRDSGTHPTTAPTEPRRQESNSNTPVAKAPGEDARPASADNTKQSYPQPKPSADWPANQPKNGTSRPNN
jgi:hypothetical protein